MFGISKPASPAILYISMVHNSNWTVPKFVHEAPRTRIVCTIGPACDSEETLSEMVKAGMSVARINLSHGDDETHRRYFSLVQRVGQLMKIRIGVLLDLPGPKYRATLADGKSRTVEVGDSIVLSSNQDSDGAIGVWPYGIHRDVRVDARIIIDDGKSELRVTEIKGEDVLCEVTVGGSIDSNKTVSLVACPLSLDYLTEDTRGGLDLALELEADFVGLSCVRNVNDIEVVEAVMAEHASRPRIVTKVEQAEALPHIEAIVDKSDAIMVARGDLGIEMDLADLPHLQRELITLANEKGKPVITATQMLESMISSPRPTRAEVTDINSAVLEGSDAIMLSGESAVGEYPVQAVQFMADIARRAEEFLDLNTLAERRLGSLAPERDVDDIIAYSAAQVAHEINAKVIIAFTESGATAARLAAFRPGIPILAAVRSVKALGSLTLRRGVIATLTDQFDRIQDMFYAGSEMARENGYAESGDLIIAVMGTPIGIPGNTNLLRVIRVDEPRPGKSS